MTARYRISPWFNTWNYNGQVINADDAGWFTPATAEMELAMQKAGFQPERVAGPGTGTGIGFAERLNEVALIFGDSLVEQGFIASTRSTRLLNWFNVANTMAGSPFRLVNGGVSGETTTQMLRRLSGLIEANNPGLIAFGPNSVNDPNNNITADVSISNLQKMFDTALASGAVVVVQTVHNPTAFNLSSSGGSASRRWYAAVNTFIRNYAATNPVLFHDFALVFNDPTSGGPKANLSYDGTHLSYRGAALIGRSFYQAVLSKMTFRNQRMPERFNAANLLGPVGAVVGNNAGATNGFALGTGASGTGPHGWLYRRETGDTVSTVDGTAGVTAASDPFAGGNKATVTVTCGKDQGGGGFCIPNTDTKNRFSNAWAATTLYSWGNRIRIDTTRSAVCHTPGTSAATAPDFTGKVIGDSVTDGTVVWMVTARPKAGDKLRILVDFDCTITGGSGTPYLWLAVTDTSGVSIFNTYANAVVENTLIPYPDVSPFTSRSTVRHDVTLPSDLVEIGECSVRLFYNGANGSVATMNCFGASMEIA